MNTKILEKTVHFFNVDLADDIPTQGYPKISETAVCTCLFLKIQQNSHERTCTVVCFQPATFNVIGKETPAYIAFCEFCEFFQESFYYGKPPANWVFFKNFTKNGDPAFYILYYYNKEVS